MSPFLIPGLIALGTGAVLYLGRGTAGSQQKPPSPPVSPNDPLIVLINQGTALLAQANADPNNPLLPSAMEVLAQRIDAAPIPAGVDPSAPAAMSSTLKATAAALRLKQQGLPTGTTAPGTTAPRVTHITRTLIANFTQLMSQAQNPTPTVPDVNAMDTTANSLRAAGLTQQADALQAAARFVRVRRGTGLPAPANPDVGTQAFPSMLSPALLARLNAINANPPTTAAPYLQLANDIEAFGGGPGSFFSVVTALRNKSGTLLQAFGSGTFTIQATTGRARYGGYVPRMPYGYAAYGRRYFGHYR